jgi:hypothetical protein
MRKIIALFLVFSVLSFSMNLIAKENGGADLIIQKKDGQQVRGGTNCSQAELTIVDGKRIRGSCFC